MNSQFAMFKSIFHKLIIVNFNSIFVMNYQNYFIFQSCTFCQKPLLFDRFEARVHNSGFGMHCEDIPPCKLPNCPLMVAAAS